MSEQELSPQEWAFKIWFDNELANSYRCCPSFAHTVSADINILERGFDAGIQYAKETMVSYDVVEKLVAALRYGKNEMGYRIYQIEGGHQVQMTGEMHTFVDKAKVALEAYDRALKGEP